MLQAGADIRLNKSGPNQLSFYSLEGAYLVDVTIARDDGQSVGAHKYIFTTSSPFFD